MPSLKRKRHTPPASRYKAGRRWEYACKKKLEAEGWTVLRTAGSHGAADLVCYRRDPRDVEGLVWFIQCKVSPTKADRDKIEGLVRSTGLTWRLM